MTMKRFLAILMLTATPGCLMPTPKIFDDPDVRAAVIEAVRESAKTWTAQNRISNPRIEAGYKMAIYAEIIGISTELSATGATAGHPATRPSN